MRNRYISALTVVGLALMACTGDDADSGDTTAATTTQAAPPEVTEPPVTEPPVTEPPVTEPPVTEPPVTEPPVTEPPVTEPDPPDVAPVFAFEMAGCEQVAIYLPIDAATAQARVSGDIELVVEDDQVTSLFLIHECTDTAVGGVAAGPAHIAAQWLPVTGQEEVRQGPQFEGVAVLPTAYWEPIYNATDNPTLNELMRAAGLDMTLATSMTFDRMPDDHQVHQVIAGSVTSNDPSDEYLWAAPNPWTAGDEVPYGDQPTGFVHIAGDLELEAVGNIRVAGVAGSSVMEADGPNEPIGAEPGHGGGVGFVTTFEQIGFTSTG